jgi:hypothetical protein
MCQSRHSADAQSSTKGLNPVTDSLWPTVGFSEVVAYLSTDAHQLCDAQEMSESQILNANPSSKTCGKLPQLSVIMRFLALSRLGTKLDRWPPTPPTPSLKANHPNFATAGPGPPRSALLCLRKDIADE